MADHLDSSQRSSDQALWLALQALFLTAILFVLILWGRRVIFLTNDDSAIQAILSGAQTGTPTPYTVYVNFALCRVLTAIYQALPGHAWYFYFLESLQFMVLFCWNYLTLRILDHRLHGRSEASGLLGIAFALASGYALALFPVLRPSFTLCSASLASMGCVLLYVALRGGWLATLERWLLTVTSCFMLVVGYLVRYNGGAIGLAFAFVIVAMHLYARWMGRRRGVGLGLTAGSIAQAVAVPVIAVLLVLAGRAVHNQAYSSPEWVAFKSLNSARSAYMDYPHDSYDDNPQLYEQVGWDKSLADVVKMWYFVDERVNIDTFTALVQGSNTKQASPIQALTTNLTARTGIFADNLLEAYVAALSALGLCAFVFCRDRATWLFAAVAMGFALSVTVYVALQGRFIFRGAYCALLPSIMLLWVLVLSSATPIVSALSLSRTAIFGMCFVIVAACVTFVGVVLATGVIGDCLGLLAALPLVVVVAIYVTRGNRSLVVTTVLMLFILASSFIVGETGHAVELSDDIQVPRIRQMQKVVQYARDNPDIVLVYPSTMGSTDPFQEYAPNIVSWGGWSYYAPWKQESFARAGYPVGLSNTMFFEDNVMFVSPSVSHARRLRSYLCSITGERILAHAVEDFDNGTVLYTFHSDGAKAQ